VSSVLSWVHLTELRSFVDFSDVDDPPSNSSFSNFVDYLVSSGFVESRSFRGKTYKVVKKHKGEVFVDSKTGKVWKGDKKYCRHKLWNHSGQFTAIDINSVLSGLFYCTGCNRAETKPLDVVKLEGDDL